MYANGMKFTRDGIRRQAETKQAELITRMRRLIAEQGLGNRTPVIYLKGEKQ